MFRPARVVMVSCVSALFALAGCAQQPPKTPEQRIAAAEEKMEDMEKYSTGEATYADYWEAQNELEEAKKDLNEQRSSVAEDDQPYYRRSY